MREKFFKNCFNHNEELSYLWRSSSYNRLFTNESVMIQIYDSPRQAILVSVSLSEDKTESKIGTFVHRHG